jgi:hypothetical protein
MAEVTAAITQRRFETVASGTYSPEIPGLPGLTFVKMGLKERGASTRAYSSKLKELMAEGGYFNEAFLPSLLERACKENGIDIGVLRKQRELMKRYMDSIPPDLNGPFDKLTPEEVALLSPEEHIEREKAIQERGKKIMEWQDNFFSENDHRLMETARQVEQLERHLKANTAEHHARKHQMETEILICARRSDDIDKPYFNSIEEIADLDSYNREGLVQLYMKWKQFKEGLLPDFFRTDNLN